MPAAPTPDINILQSYIFRSANFKEFIRAANVTMDVPC